jgi:hypothetical protein
MDSAFIILVYQNGINSTNALPLLSERENGKDFSLPLLPL